MKLRIFIESPIFSKLIGNYLDDDEYAELQAHLLKHPEFGALISKSGGVRKLRWAALGKGKSGGDGLFITLKMALRFGC